MLNIKVSKYYNLHFDFQNFPFLSTIFHALLKIHSICIQVELFILFLSYSCRKCRYEEEEESFFPCTTTALGSSIFKSESQSLIQEIIDRRSISSNVSQCYDYDYDDQSVELKHVSKQLLSPKKEEKEYVKFIYNITKEIIEKGLYTDKELRNVFKKHIDLYKGILNMV